MATGDLSMQAINQPVEIVPYDPKWPGEFEAERNRLFELFPATFSAIEHIGSTAVVGLAAKPVIDMMAAVPSMSIADEVTIRLVEFSYLFSKDFNVQLGDRRWLMKHLNGRRTHHLHLVLPGSEHLVNRIKFRNLLRTNSALAASYVSLKKELALMHPDDREAYTEAKAPFVSDALKLANQSMQPTAGSGS